MASTNQFWLVLVHTFLSSQTPLQSSSGSYYSPVFSGSSSNLLQPGTVYALEPHCCENHHGFELIRHRRAQMGSDDVRGTTEALL